MKRLIKFIKRNIKTVAAFIIGLILAGGSAVVVYAIAATNITYTDTNNIGATTVQGAIDKLYTMASGAGSFSCPGCVYRFSTTEKYTIHVTSSSITDSQKQLTSGEYTTDYSTLGKVFLGHQIDSEGNILSNYLCMNNSGLMCVEIGGVTQTNLLKYGHFAYDLLHEKLGDYNCPSYDNSCYIGCKATENNGFCRLKKWYANGGYTNTLYFDFNYEFTAFEVYHNKGMSSDYCRITHNGISNCYSD